MTIKYITDPPTEDGIYLVRVSGFEPELNVAEAYVYGNSVTWHQLGIDYDVWDHGAPEFEIAVICKLDLNKIAEAAKKQE